jgi:predicted porin
VNTYYTHTNYSGNLSGIETQNALQTGLLPTALSIGGKTRQNDIDTAFQFSFWTGVNGSSADNLHNSGTAAVGNGGLGYNSLNIRQAFLSFGDKSWGTIKAGRDLGVFGSDAILSDMTLLGVGSGAGSGGSSTLGRIGSGYIYADWLAQIAYTTPNFNGFEATVAVQEALGNLDHNELGYAGKASYSFAANDVNGKVWVGGKTSKLQNGTTATTGVTTLTGEDRAEGYEIGGKVGVAGAELVGYYYNGKNMDQGYGVAIASAASGSVTSNDNSGGYVQATYVLPTKTKVGVSYGVNRIENQTRRDVEREAYVIGAYHPLTKHLNLVAEYNHLEATNNDATNFEGKAKTVSLGAILFF